MPTNTYVALKTTTLSSSASTITFSSIPSTYTDLVLVFQCTAASANMNWDMRVGNGTVDSGSNYSATYLVGGSGGASSNRVSSQDRLRLGFSAYIQSSGGVFTAITQIMNYSNTTTNKTVLSRDNNANQSVVEAAVGLWRSTSAIDTITFGDFGGATMAAGTTATLYGIKAQVTPGTAKATGGTITYDAYGYVYHTFTGNGTFAPTQALTADVLVVAGGGGGGSQVGGGGGAGGLLAFTSQSLTAGSYSCTVGGGGAAGTYTNTGPVTNRGSSGVNSQFGSLTASIGGGGGGGYNGWAGLTGGSGGGADGNNGGVGSGTSGQGFAGGTGFATSWAGGGGGGAGGVGGNAAANVGGNGGIGATSSLINSIGAATSTGQLSSGNYYYAGGGGGCSSSGSQYGIGGLGGGARGTNNDNSTPPAGTANTGGGGGGSRDQISPNFSLPSAGGSGVVIIRYSGV